MKRLFHTAEVALGKYPNTTTGFAALAKRVRAVLTTAPPPSVHLLVEPTGGYEAALVAFAYEQAWLVTLPNPRLVRSWATGTEQRTKTDDQDAWMLARFGAARRPAPSRPWLPACRNWTTCSSGVGIWNRCSNRSRTAAASGHSVPICPMPSSEISTRPSTHCNRHWTKSMRRLPVTSRPIHPWMKNEFVPRHRQSGGSPGCRSTPLFLLQDGQQRDATFALHGGPQRVRGNNPLHPFHQRLVGRGEPKEVALAAAARKLLT
jgi:hypothetical protein